MKPLTIILLILLFACSSNKKTIKKQQRGFVVPIDINLNGNLETINPNSFLLRLKLLELNINSVNQCGVKKSNTHLFQVIGILKKGMGVINTPHVNSKIHLSILSQDQNLKSGVTIEAIANEYLCFQTKHKSDYIITEFKYIK